MSTLLCKKYFMALPTGIYQTSNCMKSRKESVFVEIVASSIPERARQWNRIVLADANGRLCHVFRTRNEYEFWLTSVYSQQ